jgi:hypothetical protein
MALPDDRIAVGGMERLRLLLPQPLIWAVCFLMGYVAYDLVWAVSLVCGGG